MLEAQISLNSKDWNDAATAAGEAGRIFSKNGNVRHGLNALWVRGEALRNLGKPAAEELLNQTFKESLRYENPVIAQLCQISLGKLKLQKQALRDAEQHFKKALRLIEDLRAPLPAEEFRMAFLADKLAPYHELARICLADEKRIPEAFTYIEEARSRSLAEAAESAEDGPAIKPPRLNKLSGELDRLREELNWFYSRLNRARPDEIPGLQQQARQREKKIAEVMRRMASAGGKQFQEKQKFDLKKLQRQLGNSRVLVEYFGLDGKISAFVLTDKTLEVFRDLCDESEIPALLEQLHFQFGALRYGAKNLDNFMADLTNKTNSYLHKLYEKLLAPLEKHLGERGLVIVPYRELHYIPFHALHNGSEYVVQSRTVSYAPSAAVLQKCLLKKQTETKDVLLMGFADEKIPLVDKEIESLAKMFGRNKYPSHKLLRCRYLKGKRATFAAFRESAGQADILHLACHGEFRPDNPMFSSLRLADGWITVRDVCAMRLKSSLVTLSACATGLNSVFGGDELLGLSRGFFSAGAASLLLTLWTVNDEAATELMGSFYRNLQRGMTLAESLREAQLGFIQEGSHPYFWSPFVLTGRW